MVKSNVVEDMYLKKITGNVFKNIMIKIKNKKDFLELDFNFELIYASAFKEDESKYFEKVDNVGDLDMECISDLIEEINELNRFNKKKEDNDNKSE